MMNDDKPEPEPVNLRAEINAIALVLDGLMKTHPDPSALLKELDRVLSSWQSGRLLSGEVGLPPGERVAMMRYRDRLMYIVAQKTPPASDQDHRP